METSKKLYENSLLSEAAYADFSKSIDPDGSYNVEKIKIALQRIDTKDEDPDDPDKGFSLSQAEDFTDHWQVVHHQPDTDSGFSATLFKNTDSTVAQPYVLAIRGTAGLQDLVIADISDIVTDGVAIDQVVDMWNYWKKLTTPKGESFSGSQLVTLTAETAALAFAKLNPLSLVPGSNLIGNAYLKWLYSRDDIIIDNNLLFERVRTIETILGGSNFSGVLDTPLTVEQLASVTGHSLGGHLSAALTRLVPGVEALTINGAGFPTGYLPGLGGDAEVNIRNLFGMLGGGDTGFNSSRILNLHGDKNFEFITQNSEFGLLQQGGQEAVFIEQKDLFAFTVGHGTAQVTNSLAVYDLLIRLDENLANMAPAAMLDRLQPLFERASNQREVSLEAIVNAIGDLLNVGTKVGIDIRDELYTRLKAINAELYVDPVQADPQLKTQYQNLQIVDVNSLAGSATLDSTDGLAYRYALTELNSFAITGNANLYNADELKAESFSEQYLTDRAQFLSLLLTANAGDKSYAEFTQGSTHQGYRRFNEGVLTDQYNLLNAEPSNTPNIPDLKIIAFNDNGSEDTSLEGLSQDDRLYGGFGKDIINGQGGNDLIEGGAGDDTLIGGKGRFDIVDGGIGNDTYIFNTGDQQITIRDADMNGKIIIKNGAEETVLGLDNPLKKVTANVSLYSDDKGNTFRLNGNRLFITTAIGEKIIVEDFSSGNLGITFPADPIIPPTINTILGDNNLTIAKEDDIYGSDNVDHIKSGALYDRVLAEGGNDIIDGGSGTDELLGGAGDDMIEGGSETDIILGGTGDDLLFADNKSDYSTIFMSDTTPVGTTQDWLLGGDGNDQLIGSAGGDALFGGGGHDLLAGGAGDDFIDGDHNWGTTSFEWTATKQSNGITAFSPSFSIPGSDDDGNDSIFAGAGNDTVWGGGGNDHIFGDSGNDVLLGDEGDDYLHGGTGEDELQGGAGNDRLDGGDNVDLLIGNGGNDTLLGGKGNDQLQGGEGDDRLYGNEGDDVLFGQLGDDDLTGNNGDDILLGGEGNDILRGELGKDELQGGDGDDYLYGGEGNDLLFGDNDNDHLIGGKGDDQLQGNSGNDTLNGNSGDDFLLGGTGNDHYLINVNDGRDTIFDSGGAEDKVILGSGISQSNVKLTQGGNDLFITFIGSSDQVAVKDWFSDNNRIETIEFNDGSHYDIATILTQVEANRDKTISGTTANDTLQGGYGNDVLAGGMGDDTYIFTLGGGIDEIDESPSGNFPIPPSGIINTGYDKLIFGSGISANQLRLERVNPTNSNTTESGDLYIHVNENDIVIIRDWFDPPIIVGNVTIPSPRIEAFVFADNTVWNSPQILQSLNGEAINLSPVLNQQLADLEISKGETIEISIPENTFIDPEGDVLRYSATLADNSALPSWLQFNRHSLVLSGTPERNYNGVLDIAITATDSKGLSTTDTLNITVGSAYNIIQGTPGNDELRGTMYDDQLIGGAGNDTLYGNDGNDIIDGGSGRDILYGRDGNDHYLFGYGHGLDIINDKDGTNTIILDTNITPADLSVQLDGKDLILALNQTQDQIRYKDFATFNNSSQTYQASSKLIEVKFADNTIWDSNTLFSFLTFPTVNTQTGTTGDDLFFVDDQHDMIEENPDQGIDTVNSSSSYTLPENVENITLTGFINTDATGNSLNNTLRGNSGSNSLDGKAGIDHYFGGAGDDVYHIDNKNEFANIVENTNEGIDSIFYRGSDHLSVTLAGHVENMDLTFTSYYTFQHTSHFTGNDLDNTISIDAPIGLYTRGPNKEHLPIYFLFGEGGNDYLTGSLTSDSLSGGTGNDSLYGGANNDILYGGTGMDQLIGGDDQDIYLFNKGDDNNTAGITTVFDTAIQNGNIFLFGIGVSVDDIRFEASQDDLIVHYSNSDKVLVLNGSIEAVITNYTFSDGATYSYDELVQRLTANNIYSYNKGNGKLIISDLIGNDKLVFGNEIDKGSLTLEIKSNTDSTNLLGQQYKVFSSDQRKQKESEMAALKDGGYVVAWVDSTERNDSYNSQKLFFQRYDANGEKQGEAEKVVRFDKYLIDNTSVVALSNGGFAISRLIKRNSRSSTEKEIWSTVYDSDGMIVQDKKIAHSTRFSLSTTVALKNGGYIVTWNSFTSGTGSTINGLIYDNTGRSTGSFEFIGDLTTNIHDLMISALPDGGFVSVWQKTNQFHIQRFNAEGNKIGEENTINSAIENGSIRDATITVLKNGTFLLAWSSVTGGVFAHYLDNQGNKTGAAFQLNTFVGGAQREIAVTSLDGGGFFAVWVSNEQDGDSAGIIGQRFNAQGLKVGNELQINQSTVGKQLAPAITNLNNGEIIVSWGSDHQYGQSGIFAQRIALESDSLHITFNDDLGDEIVINNWSGNGHIENFQFADNTLLNGSDLTPEIIDDTYTGTIYGDILNSGDGNDILIGGAGNDTLIAGSGSDWLQGGSGEDTLVFSEDNSWSSSFIAYNAGSPGHRGTAERISITAMHRSYDLFDGGEGQDTIQGTDGNDAVFLHDIFSPLPNGTGPRVKNVERFDMGAGDDIVDLTSPSYSLGDVILNGGLGNDVLWASSGNDVLKGGQGNDKLSGGVGNDTYLFARGDNQDTILEYDTTANNHDVLSFLHNINHDQLWFTKNSDDLHIQIIGTQEQVAIKDWYVDAAFQIEEIQASDGHILVNNQIDQLVQAMASFNAPASGELSLSSEHQQQLAPVLAASWV